LRSISPFSAIDCAGRLHPLAFLSPAPLARRTDLRLRPLCGAVLLAAAIPLGANASDGPALTGLVAAADDAVTAATNPAGLTRLHQSEWVGGISAFYARSDFTTTAQSVGGSSSSSSSTSVAIPAIYYARPINENATFGISLTVPSGLGSNPGDKTAARYLLEQWSLGYASLTPAAGYRINEQFSVGIGVNLNYTLYDYQSAVFNGPGQPDGKMELRDSVFGMGFQLGMLYELTPTTRLGLSYTSATSSNFSSTPELSGLSSNREATLPAGVRSQQVQLESKFPQHIGTGVWHEFADGKSATLDVLWINFSRFGLSSATLGGQSIEVTDQRYQDIWAASAGVKWPLNDAWAIRFGAAYASSGVDSENRSFSLRLDRVVGGGVGAEYRWSGKRQVGVNLTYYDLGGAPVAASIPLLGTLSGNYTSNYAIGLDMTLRWIQ
jgi:long-chain fatty acid transport protein